MKRNRICILVVQNEDRDQKVVPRLQAWVDVWVEVPLAVGKEKFK